MHAYKNTPSVAGLVVFAIPSVAVSLVVAAGASAVAAACTAAVVLTVMYHALMHHDAELCRRIGGYTGGPIYIHMYMYNVYTCTYTSVPCVLYVHVHVYTCIYNVRIWYNMSHM